MDSDLVPPTMAVRINGRLHLPGLIMTSGNLEQSTPTLKRQREEDEQTQQYSGSDQAAQNQAVQKYRKTSQHDVFSQRSTRVLQDGTKPVSIDCQQCTLF